MKWVLAGIVSLATGIWCSYRDIPLLDMCVISFLSFCCITIIYHKEIFYDNQDR